MPANRRRRRVIERTREDILEAAARAFSRSGFHSVTMRDIAQEAGYTAASLYNYFKSKQEIVDGLFALVNEEFLKMFDEQHPAGLSLRQRLQLLMSRHLGFLEHRRDLHALLVTLNPASKRSTAEPSAGHGHHNPFWAIETHIERLAQWFQAHGLEEKLGGHSPEVAARFMVGIAHSFLVPWLLRSSSHEALVERGELILDLFLNGIGAGTRPDAGAATT